MEIQLDNIVTDRFDVREEVDENHVKEIAESLKEDGQWNPIIVRPGNDGQYELIAGHTRVRAAERIGWDALEATVKDVDDEQGKELALKTNLKRKSMDKIEEGKVINDVLESADVSETELAERLGKSQRWVSERIQVALELDPKVKGLVQEGDLSYNIARIVTQVDEDRQLEFAELLIENEVTDAAEASRVKHRFLNDTIYTIGYEGMDFSEFAERLEAANIEVLVDIRASGDSTYKPAFNSDVLGDRLQERGIEYRHVPEAGVHRLIRGPYKNQSIGHGCFEDWYHWWIEEESEIDLTEFAFDLEAEGKPALMCIEENPEPKDGQNIYCHRHHLAEMLQSIEKNDRKVFPNRKDL